MRHLVIGGGSLTWRDSGDLLAAEREGTSPEHARTCNVLQNVVANAEIDRLVVDRSSPGFDESELVEKRVLS